MKLAILLMALSVNVQAVEWSFGYGDSYRADSGNNPFYSITLGQDDWKFSLTRWESYERTSWLSTNPEWGIYTVGKHHIFAVTKEIYQFDFSSDFNFYVDLGIAYTDVESRMNSSSLLFKEAIGLEYKQFRVSLTHTSNAGFEGINTGEDGLLFEYIF